MAIEIPTTEPEEVVAGDFITWKIPENSDRTIVDGWILSYAFVTAGKKHSVTCTDNGDNHHLAEISIADSKEFPSGHYAWQSYLTKGTERYKVNDGELEVKPNFAEQAGGYDGRTYWETVLANVEAVIKGRATKDQSSYTVNGRQLSRTPIADLLVLYDRAKAGVASDKNAKRVEKGLGTSGTILTRF